MKCNRLNLPKVFGRLAAGFCCAALLLFSLPTNSQVAGAGSIQGTVTDASGAVIANASVSLTEPSTHVTLSTKTDSSGIYVFPNISIGTYTLTVRAPGFKTYTSTGNVLEIGSSIAINAAMTIGGANIEVEVHAEGMALQTEDPSFKQTVDGTEMTEMPLNGRTVMGLVSLAGATQSQSPGDSTGSKFPAQSTGMSIAGAQGNAVTWRLDGGDNIDYMGGTNGPLPFPDAVSQFSVETSALGGQASNEAGGVVNFVTKSGTNTFHGSAFEFIRSNYIDADNFFSTSKDTLHQNQYGGTFGGPVRIPWLFDGRNKLFFFAAYQHSHADSASATSNAYLPTKANLAGDFSTTDPAPVASGGTGVKNACGPVQQLYDPISGALLPDNKYNYSAMGYPAVPLPAWNASALLVQQQFPAIDPTLDTNNCGHISYSIPSIITYSDFITRVDYNISPKNNFYARYYIDSFQQPTFYSPTNIFLTTQSGNPEIRWQTITFGENYVISSNLVNTAHVTAVRRQLSRGFNSATPNASAFGVKSFQPITSGIYINYSTSGENHGSAIGGGSNLLAVIDDNTPVDIADDVTWVRGKHQFAFGAAFVHNQLNVNNGYQADGNFSFNGNWSGNGTPADATLDFLEGAMNSFTQSLAQQNALRGSMRTIYAQDTFHATPRLTITAGIRWEPLFVPHDYFHRGTEFSLSAFLANQVSAVYPQAPPGTFYYGDRGVSANFTKNSPLEFSPNLGVAYNLFGNGKTVLRAGAAYAYDQPNFFFQQRVQQNAPFSVNISPNSSSELCFSDPWLIGGTGNRGCGQTGGTDIDPFPFNAKNFTFPQQGQYIVLASNYQMPNTLQWTASIQQELPHGWTLQIFYNGNRTQHQLSAIPLSQVWGRGPELPRIFFPERLPAFFSRTIVFDSDFAREAKLSWIFTGREGGFTVEVSHTMVRVYQRYYDSYGLLDSHTANPERIVQETVVQAPSAIHSLTVTLDAHLWLSVLVNGVSVVEQNCMLDVSRHQLLFQGPRSRHIELAGSLLSLQATETEIRVDASVRHQTVYGFGGSPSIPAYDSLSEEGKKEYWQILSRYNLLIDREYPMGTKLRPDMSNLDNLADAKPHYYGDDFPNGEVTDFAYNAQTLKLGGKVIYEMWGLPAWATMDYTDPDSKEHKEVANPSVWARAMVTYARIEKERTGRAPDVIGIQNEVQEPKEISFEMVRTLRTLLDAAGLKEVKIHMPDASNAAIGTEVGNTLRSDPEVWSKIDIAASHEYDYQDHFADPDSFDDQLKALRQANGDKPFLATEIAVNNVRLQSSSYRVAFNVGQLYHKNMTLMDAIGLAYCWLILDVEQPNFGATRSLLVPDRYHGDIPVASSYQLRVLGAYSRHLREGMVRVDAASPNSDLLVSAYEGGDDARTLIATNRGTTSQILTVNWPGTTWNEMERVSQYSENKREPIPAKIVIQPGEIVTLSTLVLPSTDK